MSRHQKLDRRIVIYYQCETHIALRNMIYILLTVLYVLGYSSVSSFRYFTQGLLRAPAAMKSTSHCGVLERFQPSISHVRGGYCGSVLCNCAFVTKPEKVAVFFAYRRRGRTDIPRRDVRIDRSYYCCTTVSIDRVGGSGRRQ